MNTKETLKRLHKKFPMMGLDELFEVLDCYVEEYKISEPKLWYSTTDPIKTNSVDKISRSTNAKMYYDGNTITTAEPSSVQFTTSH